ncbi:MAG: DUF1616 domain-containing protein [Ktedonobacteraceae bacterium]|nr:DUF1616 domain-containing protein [Ktedonobacteraceae bacterium]
MKHTSVDIRIVIASALMAGVLVWVMPANSLPFRLLLAPFIFIVPGYALTCALFVHRLFGRAEHSVFSLGLSLVIMIVGGLVLNLTPFGLQATSWIVFLCSVTLIAGAVTLMRRRGQNRPVAGWLQQGGNPGLTVRQVVFLAMALIILSGGVAVSIVGASRQPYPGFTQCWILPASGLHSKAAVRLGVSNMESTSMEYRLDVNMNGKVIKSWPAIHLDLHAKWETTLVLPSSTSKGATKVEALLYRVDTPTKIYRHVLLWLGT